MSYESPERKDTDTCFANAEKPVHTVTTAMCDWSDNWAIKWSSGKASQ